MEHKENENIQQHIDKLIDLIYGFYTEEHFTESGVVYKFTHSKTRERIQFIIENAYYNPESLWLTDQNELFEIIGINQNKYIQETLEIDNMINDNQWFYIFTIEFNQKIAQIYEQKKRNDIIYAIKQALNKWLKSIEDINNSLKDNSIHIKHTTQTEEGKVCLIETKEKEYVFVNINKKDITYRAGEGKEKRYKYDDTKIFIFTERTNIKQIIYNQIKIKKIIDPDMLIKDFLLQIAEKYHNNTESIRKKIDTIKDLQTKNISETISDLETLSIWLTVIAKKVGIQAKEYNIFVDHGNSKLQHIGLFQSYETPQKLENDYRWKKAIHMLVNDWEKAIVINSDNYDIFDISK